MSKLQELIDHLCPNGVEFKPLGELGTFFGGLTGKSKDDFKDGNAKFITYLNIYTNPALNIDVNDFVKVDEKEKQNRIQKGDILFTGSSETPNECGFTSVVTSEVPEPIYLNSFCFGLRLSNPALFNLDFLKHILRSEELRKQIGKTASGVTRFNVSKARLSKVVLPIPPIEVQDEIVKILDRFSDYAAELQAELQARRLQYEYYRNLLLTFNPSAYGCGTDDAQKISVIARGGHSYKIQWKTMGEIGKFFGGLTGKSKADFSNGNARFISYMNVYSNIALDQSANEFVSILPDEKQNVLQYGDALFTGSSETPNECGMSSVVTTEPKEPLYLNSFSFGFRLDNISTYHPDFLKHLLRSTAIRDQIAKTANGVTRFNVSKALFAKIILPIPPIELQVKIASILDRFETLVNDLSKGLPAEIEAVKARYEYYRNKLLTFNPLSA